MPVHNPKTIRVTLAQAAVNFYKCNTAKEMGTNLTNYCRKNNDRHQQMQ